MRKFWFAIGFVLTLLSFAGAQEEAPPARLAVYQIYFEPNETTPSLRALRKNNPYFNCEVDQAYALATAVYHTSPIFTDADIVEYCWQDQRIELTPAGAARWDALGGFEVPQGGIPVMVLVDEVPRYCALVRNPVSSRGSRLPEAWCKTMENKLRLGGKLVSAEGDTILTPSFDPQVKQLMQELGKLTERCGD